MKDRERKRKRERDRTSGSLIKTRSPLIRSVKVSAKVKEVYSSCNSRQRKTEKDEATRKETAMTAADIPPKTTATV